MIDLKQIEQKIKEYKNILCDVLFSRFGLEMSFNSLVIGLIAGAIVGSFVCQPLAAVCGAALLTLFGLMLMGIVCVAVYNRVKAIPEKYPVSANSEESSDITAQEIQHQPESSARLLRNHGLFGSLRRGLNSFRSYLQTASPQ